MGVRVRSIVASGLHEIFAIRILRQAHTSHNGQLQAHYYYYYCYYYYYYYYSGCIGCVRTTPTDDVEIVTHPRPLSPPLPLV